jgi:hypothetical protein
MYYALRRGWTGRDTELTCSMHTTPKGSAILYPAQTGTKGASTDLTLEYLHKTKNSKRQCLSLSLPLSPSQSSIGWYAVRHMLSLKNRQHTAHMLCGNNEVFHEVPTHHIKNYNVCVCVCVVSVYVCVCVCVSVCV